MARLLGLSEAPKEARLAFSYFRRGWTCKQIDEHFKWVPGSAHMLIRGIWEHDCEESPAAKRKRAKRTVTEEEIEKVRRLRQKGATIYEISVALNRPEGTVKSIIRREGLEKCATSPSSRE